MPPAIRVLVVDDSADIGDMLGYVIGVEPDMEIAGCLDSANDLSAKVGELRPDIVVMDVSMPGREPLAAATECAQEFPAVRTIIYSGYDDPELIERIIDAGAWGFVSKRKDPDVLIRAIREVAAGRIAFPQRSPRPA